MATVPNAAPIDHALDEVARETLRYSVGLTDDAARVAALWRQVFIAAVDAHDVRLASIAAPEYFHWRGIASGLAEHALVRPPP